MLRRSQKFLLPLDILYYHKEKKKKENVISSGWFLAGKKMLCQYSGRNLLLSVNDADNLRSALASKDEARSANKKYHTIFSFACIFFDRL